MTTREGKPFIAGAFRDGSGELVVHNPYNAERVGVVQLADARLVELAIEAGDAAAPALARRPAHERSALCHLVADGIRARAAELAELICLEAGKPMKAARGEVARAEQTFRFAAIAAGQMSDPGVDLGAAPGGEGRFGVVRRFPVGLVSAISPFNFPLNLVSHKVAPSFAFGNPVVLKPASKTPLTALALAEICHASGAPPGSLSVVPCSRKDAKPFTLDERFKLLTFTGSPEVGWAMKARAGKKKVVLELGGDAAVIVDKGVDLYKAARRAAWGAFVYAGQVCISVQRVLVHQDVYAEFRARFVQAAEEIVTDDPRDERTVCGPLIDEENVERVLGWIKEAQAGGAKVLCGGHRKGHLIKPAVLENVPGDVKLSCQEVFGPVCTLASFRDLDDAIAQVNRSSYGLQAGIFTDSIDHVWRAYEGLEVGGVIHNDVPTFRVDHMPYGGIKDSGFGREGLPWAIEDYTERKLLALKPDGLAG